MKPRDQNAGKGDAWVQCGPKIGCLKGCQISMLHLQASRNRLPRSLPIDWLMAVAFCAPSPSIGLTGSQTVRTGDC